jgi:penicillin-binding protein 1A
MNGPLKAGEPLAPSSKNTPAGNPQGKRRPIPGGSRPPHRRNLFVRVMRGLVGAVMGVAVLVAAVGGVGGWVAWQHFSAGLPDVDGLRNYQPPVMSRVFAGDGRLLAELATERRIFVPITRISTPIPGSTPWRSCERGYLT